MKKQSFKWYKSDEQLPENYQSNIVISYLYTNGSGKTFRIVTTMIGFNPAVNIEDGKLIYGTESVCDYWSPLPNMPKDAPYRYTESIPAICDFPKN